MSKKLRENWSTLTQNCSVVPGHRGLKIAVHYISFSSSFTKKNLRAHILVVLELWSICQHWSKLHTSLLLPTAVVQKWVQSTTCAPWAITLAILHGFSKFQCEAIHIDQLHLVCFYKIILTIIIWKLQVDKVGTKFVTIAEQKLAWNRVRTKDDRLFIAPKPEGCAPSNFFW